MGIAQNLRKEENVVVTRGGGSTAVQTGLAQAARQGSLAGDSKAKVRYLESRPTRNMSFATERETRTAAAWNAWQMLGEFCTAKVDFKFKHKRLQSIHTGRTAVRLVRLSGTRWTRCERCQNKLARRLLVDDEERLGQRAKKRSRFRPKSYIESLELCQLQWNSESDAKRWAERMTEQIPKHAVSHSKCWRQFLDSNFEMTSLRWKNLTRDTILCAN